MNRRHRAIPSNLEKELGELANAIAIPTTPELSERVRARIESPTARRRRMLAARFALAAAVLIAAIGSVALFSSTAREAVADWFGIRGIDIVDNVPPPERTGRGLSLGQRSSLERARRLVPFEVSLPAVSGLGPPDEVYIDETNHGSRSVSLLYRAEGSLPPAAETSIGLLITQFEAGLDDDLMQKAKAPGVEVEPVRIGSSPAYWISGRPHFVFLLDPGGGVIEDRTRLAGNTLLWEWGRVSLRLESGLGKRRAVRIARSMRTP